MSPGERGPMAERIFALDDVQRKFLLVFMARALDRGHKCGLAEALQVLDISPFRDLSGASDG